MGRSGSAAPAAPTTTTRRNSATSPAANSTRPPLHELGCTFLGVNCSQSWDDFQLWERFLNEHPQLRSVVELGTGEGGFSRYLHLQCQHRRLEFATFDRVHMDEHTVPGFQQLDIFEQADRVCEAIHSPCVLFCDGGDKPRELVVFVPRLQPADFVIVHDWATEVTYTDIPPMLTPVHTDWCLELHSWSRIFARVGP